MFAHPHSCNDDLLLLISNQISQERSTTKSLWLKVKNDILKTSTRITCTTDLPSLGCEAAALRETVDAWLKQSPTNCFCRGEFSNEEIRHAMKRLKPSSESEQVTPAHKRETPSMKPLTKPWCILLALFDSIISRNPALDELTWDHIPFQHVENIWVEQSAWMSHFKQICELCMLVRAIILTTQAGSPCLAETPRLVANKLEVACRHKHN